MKKLLFLLLFISNSNHAQEALSLNFKEYSYSQLFEMMQQEKDSVFVLENALIRFDDKKDSLFIKEEIDLNNRINIKTRPSFLVIDIPVRLKNVHFEAKNYYKDNTAGFTEVHLRKGVIHRIQFNKDLIMRDCLGVIFENCNFKSWFTFSSFRTTKPVNDFFNKKVIQVAEIANIKYSKFFGRVNIVYAGILLEKRLNASISLTNNQFYFPEDRQNRRMLDIFGRNIYGIVLSQNTFHNKGYILFNDINNESRGISNNVFGDTFFEFRMSGSKGFDNLNFKNNQFRNPPILRFDALKSGYVIDYRQFQNQIASEKGLGLARNFLEKKDSTNYWSQNYIRQSDSLVNFYTSKMRFSNLEAFNEEMALRGMFHEHYKSRFNHKEANMVYVDMKNLETERLRYEYEQSNSFETFFSLQINLFLKVFSAYGTSPAKSIVFSVYVIIIFALIYLFFPNSWDKHGKNRIMDRYRFFTKYMNKDAGMHDVYLEEQEEELLASEDFKTYMLKAEKTIPKFFIATALPLYKWSVSGTKLTASMLKRVDIMKGTWSDLPQQKRIWKSILLIGAFTIAICYDVLIKMLNALMLSINTFTTLGFGEIPIKGLPRYLAIIQGFIGWFMLTIFSVSLISQLLN